MSTLFEKNKLRNIISIGLPALISVLGVVINVSDNGAFRITIYIIEVILLILVVIFLIIFGKQDALELEKMNKISEDNEFMRKVVNHLEKQNSAYVKNNNSLAFLTENWANKINVFANNVRNNSSVRENDWDKKGLYNLICEKCRDFIQDYVGIVDPSKVAVGFITCIDDETIVFVAHSNSESSRPEKFECEEKIMNSKYHYAKLIQDKVTDIEVACNNEEVRRLFRDVNPGSSLAKYTQYIAIPVYCSKRKMLGVFQIVTKHDYCIEKTDVELKKFAECNLVLFADLLVLVDKIHKGLYAKPSKR